MSKFILSLFLVILSFSLLLTDAEAKRFGGGKSFGVSRSSRSYSTPYNNTASRTQTANKPSGMSRWLGPLAGFAMGGLLASLFMGHGLGTGIMSWLMIAGVIFLLWQLFARFRQNQRPLSQHAYQTQAQQQYTDYQSQHNVIDANVTPFDVNPFLRHAKLLFIRLQAAYDNKNTADIREFTTPDVFAEIQMQLSERGADDLNQTDVISVNAELLDHNIETQDTISVRFTGMVREQPQSNPEPFKEIWHFTKHHQTQEWIVAGIQQE